MSLILSTQEESHKAPENNPGMKVEKVNLDETGSFSSLFLDYLNEDPKLRSYYNQYPTLQNFKKVIEERNFPGEQREILSQVLTEQYNGISCSLKTTNNIGLLTEQNAFTITTGHQLNIFTGPLYFIYKIVTTINLAKKLKKEYPEYHFIPVYWMASEDHDFEEINHLNLFGKKYSWNTSQKGPVGRFNPKEMADILNDLPEKPPLFEKAYLEHKTLAEATRYFVNELFGNEGLLVVDGDSRTLKAALKPIIKDDLTHNTAHSIVEKSSSELADEGYKVQVYPREINLFFMEENSRNRIVKNDEYEVLNTETRLSEKDLFDVVETETEKISPNVILRPLYQELILPNIAYIGGPAEIAYWLQLKPLFDHHKVDFPILLPRNFALVINKTSGKKLSKLNIPVKDLFKDLHSLKSKFVLENSENNISLEQEKKILNQIFNSILHKVTAVDQSLEGMVNSENSKTLKGLENLEKRLKKAEEQNQEVAIKQLETLKSKLFPNDSLQERTDNFLNFYLNNPSFIEKLIELFDPLEFKFNILLENE